MPHIIVKAWPGKSEDQKQRLAQAITREVMEILNYGADPVSVAIEEIEPDQWRDAVYLPDIQNGAGKLYKKPGYTM